MRILYVIDGLGGSGGAEQSLRALTPHLCDAGHELTVVSLGPTAGISGSLTEAGALVVVPEGPIGWRGAEALVRGVAESIRPDLVHTTLFQADVVGRVAALRARLPVVTSLVNSAYGPEHRHDPNLRVSRVRMAQALDVVTSRRVRRFHALTEHVADAMARRLAVRRSRIEVIPRGRDPEDLGVYSDDRRVAVRRTLGIENDRTVLLAAARHEYQKGLDVVLRAFPAVQRQHPDALLLLGGRDGNRTGELRSLVDELGIADGVRFLGSRDDVPDLLCATDVFVMPSRWEGMGSILVEAMGLGTPTVASDVPAIRESRGPSVDLVRPDSSDALASAIHMSLTRAPDDVDARRARARERFLERYTSERVAAEMVGFWHRALGR